MSDSVKISDLPKMFTVVTGVRFYGGIISTASYQAEFFNWILIMQFTLFMIPTQRNTWALRDLETLRNNVYQQGTKPEYRMKEWQGIYWPLMAEGRCGKHKTFYVARARE